VSRSSLSSRYLRNETKFQRKLTFSLFSAIIHSDNKKSRIIPRHLQLAIKNDEELDRLFQGVILREGKPSVITSLSIGEQTS